MWGSNGAQRRTGFGATDIWKIRPDGTGATKIVDGADPYHNWGAPGHAAAPQRRDRARADARGAQARRACCCRGEGVEGAEITLDASASKPGADEAAISKYEWDLDGDGVYTDAEGVAPKTTFRDEGTYSVGVLVTDATGKSSTATAEVTVTNAAPDDHRGARRRRRAGELQRAGSAIRARATTSRQGVLGRLRTPVRRCR